jgi:hypothetical protein
MGIEMNNLEGKLSKLKRLYDQGLITKSIYEKNKQEILSSGNPLFFICSVIKSLVQTK